MKKFLLIFGLAIVFAISALYFFTVTDADKMLENTTSLPEIPEVISQEKPSESKSPIDVLPAGWTYQPYFEAEGYTQYEVTFPSGTLSIKEINVDAWLAGPDPEEGYVIDHETRPIAFSILENIYTHETITDEDRTLFEAYGGEFLGYSVEGRAALTYAASQSNDYRGISFFNLYGQAPGVYPVYYVTLYNKDTSTIVSMVYGIYNFSRADIDQPKEIREVNAFLPEFGRSWDGVAPETIAAWDKEAHNNFKTLLETSPRNNLSFGGVLDAIDGYWKLL